MVDSITFIVKLGFSTAITVEAPPPLPALLPFCLLYWYAVTTALTNEFELPVLPPEYLYDAIFPSSFLYHINKVMPLGSIYLTGLFMQYVYGLTA